MKQLLANLINKTTLEVYFILKPFVKEETLLSYKPVHLCWWFRQNGFEIPKYFIAGKVVAPTVDSTSPATSIAGTTATASGNITATGGANATVRGVCYVAGTGTPTLSDTVNSESGTFGTGAFSRNLTGLTQGTLYTFRAYATNSAGTGFGANVQFTTTGQPTVALNTPADEATGVSTTPTLEFTGTDAEGDDIRYQVQVDTVNTFDGDGANGTADSYSDSNINSHSKTHTVRQGQSFNGNGGLVSQVTFYLLVEGSNPTSGTFYAEIFAHTGTYGGGGVGTGSALATSTSKSFTDISTTRTAITFTFPSPIKVVSGTKYVVVVNENDLDRDIFFGGDDSSPSHGGSVVGFSASWTARTDLDAAFIVTTTTAPLLDKLSGTDSGFANTVTPADTDPFNSGEKADYDVQSALTASTTYYWRVRAIDPSGSNTYGDWSATRSFTTTSGSSAALTGTVTASITEADIVTGGKTIILTLTGDTFIAAGTGSIGTTANTQALIDGIDSAQAEGTGWDAVVRPGIETTDVVRTSDTVATITLDAEATYNITGAEIITATIPAAVLTGAVPIVAAPTFTITSASFGVSGSLLMMGMGM